MFKEEGESGAEIPLEPVGADELRAQWAQRNQPNPPEDPPATPVHTKATPRASDEFQFPLLSIFILMAFAAVAFSVGRIFTYPVVAGVLGLVVLFWQVALMFFEPRISALHLSWWGALFIYLLIAGMAIFR